MEIGDTVMKKVVLLVEQGLPHLIEMGNMEVILLIVNGIEQLFEFMVLPIVLKKLNLI